MFALVALLALSISFASPEGVRLWLIAWFAHLTCLALFAWGGVAKGFASKCSPGGVRLVVIAGRVLACSVRLGLFAWGCSPGRVRIQEFAKGVSFWEYSPRGVHLKLFALLIWFALFA